MVIARLTDGLGNQLFQYALGLRLASDARTRLVLDLSRFTNNPTRSFRLGQFPISAALATAAQCRRADRPSRLFRWVWWLDHRRRYEKRYFRIERQFHFDPAAVHARRHLFVTGYWQSARYVSGIAERLRRELRFCHPPDAANAALLDAIGAVEAVSVHVRRGDYVALSKLHSLCSVAYYRAAVAAIRARVRDPRFFVFSDEPDWVRAELGWLSPATIVTHNGVAGDVDDLRLMSHCRHHVIANSTFSWWAAWLNPRPNKIVAAPRRWFAAGVAHSTADLLPPDWLQIDG